MTRNRWWHLVMAASLVAVAFLVLINQVPPLWTTAAAIGVLAALGLAYATFGRRAFDDARWGLPFQLTLIAATALGTAFSPNMAVLQCIAFPLLWLLCDSHSVLRPILFCLVLGAGVTGGFYFSTGRTLDALAQGAVIESVSVALGIGIGVWFTAEVRKGEENTRLLAELQAAQSKLAAANRESGAMGERERLAREIHDTIAQSLTSLVMLAQRSKAQLPPDGSSARDSSALSSTRDDLELIERVARDALTETRALVAASAPVGMEGGLVNALDRLLGHYTRETGMTVETDFDSVTGMERGSEVVLLRCAQEALANVRKHSGATGVRLTLRSDGTSVSLAIDDDGRGFEPDGSHDGGFGIAGMKQRLALVGGTLSVGRNSVGGAKVVATLPIVLTPAAEPAMKPGNAEASGPAASDPAASAPAAAPTRKPTA